MALALPVLALTSLANPGDTAAAPAAVTATPPSTVVVAESPQARMSRCQAEATAKSLKGADRQSFLSTCLKKKPTLVANAQQQRMRSCQTEATSRGLQGSDRTTFLSGCLKNAP